jgi:2-C-methyl-D-erythritol 4-phosphate cytidylyltransferase
MTTAAIIVAAGRGLRMADAHNAAAPGPAALPKQYLPLAGRPILAHTIERFEATPAVDRMVLVVVPGDEALCEREIVAPFGFRKVAAIVAGGAHRQESVARGLAALAGPVDLVAVHDGVRPCVTPEQIGAVIEAAERADGAVLAIPLNDTPKQVGAHRLIERTLERRVIWLAQTPQVFRRAVLQEGHAKAAADGYLGTDDAALVERLGYRVVVVEGSASNVKITLPDDLAAAESWLAAHQLAAPGYGARRPRL